MPLSAPEYEESIESKIRRAVMLLVSEDEYFAEKYAFGSTVKVRGLRPLIEDDLIQVPMFFAQNVPERDAMNRMLGSFTKNTVHIRCVLVEDADTEPIADNETSIIDDIVHFERLLEWGSDGEGKGKLYDPDVEDPSTVPSTTRYLNDLPPVITRLTPVEHDLSKTDDQSSIAMFYQIIVSYETQQNRNTRRTQ